MFVLEMADLNHAGKRAFIRADLNMPQDVARATTGDFNHNPAPSLFDATLTKVTGGTLVKALSWYDNERGFSNRMPDVTVALMNAK